MAKIEKLPIRLKELRGELSQRKFADSIGVSYQTLSGYEKGTVTPPLDIAKNIAEKCEVSIDWLCGLSENRRVNGKPKTMGDVFRMILLMADTVEVLVYSHKEENPIPAEYREYIEGADDSVLFNMLAVNTYINVLIGEWEKMRQLHNNLTVDLEVYNLWVEKTLGLLDTMNQKGETFADFL